MAGAARECVSAEVYRGKMQDAGFDDVEIQEIGASVIPGYYLSRCGPKLFEP